MMFPLGLQLIGSSWLKAENGGFPFCAMGKLYYHNTFLDEMPATTEKGMIRSASCPAIMASVPEHCKSRMFDQWHSKLQLAMLNSMSEGTGRRTTPSILHYP